MFLILNKANLVADITKRAQYVKRQENGVIVICDKENADAIYSENADTFYEFSVSGYIPDGYTLVEVDEVPAGIVAGYYFYHAKEFYTTDDRLTALAGIQAARDAQAVASVTFVTLSEAGQIDDVTAVEHASQFSPWVYPIAYTVGQIRKEGEKLYRCVQAHTSQEDWKPSATPALWKEVGDPAVEWPDWSQPIGAHDAYSIGDKVTYDKKHYVSSTNNNVWAPGVYGWTVAD